LSSSIVERAGLLNLMHDIRDVAVERLAQTLTERSYGWQRKLIQEAGLYRQNQGGLVGKPQGACCGWLRTARIRTPRVSC
jgi:hypothetical protein